MLFTLRVFSVNVTKSAKKLRIWSHLLKKLFMENFISREVSWIILAPCGTKTFSGIQTDISLMDLLAFLNYDRKVEAATGGVI